MATKAQRRKQLVAGFTAEAKAAASYRAYARRAESDGLPNLARHWLSLAMAKDQLAIDQLEAISLVRGGKEDLESAIADQRKENEVFYPKMMTVLDDDLRPLIEKNIESQRQHIAWMEALLGALAAARGDVEAPVDEVGR